MNIVIDQKRAKTGSFQQVFLDYSRNYSHLCTMNYHYIIWNITESEEELRAGLLHPERFAQKVENLKPGSRRMLEVLAVRRAMKVLFYEEEKEVLYNADGAPYLADGPYISISHTDGYAAVIASEEFPVGIDIERRGTRVERVVSHFLRPEELVVLQMAAEEIPSKIDYQLLLHLAWSAKETAFKILGKEYYDLQNLTTVQFFDLKRKIILLSVKDRPAPLKIHFYYTDDFVLTFIYEGTNL